MTSEWFDPTYPAFRALTPSALSSFLGLIVSFKFVAVVSHDVGNHLIFVSPGGWGVGFHNKPFHITAENIQWFSGHKVGDVSIYITRADDVEPVARNGEGKVWLFEELGFSEADLRSMRTGNFNYCLNNPEWNRKNLSPIQLAKGDAVKDALLTHWFWSEPFAPLCVEKTS